MSNATNVKVYDMHIRTKGMVRREQFLTVSDMQSAWNKAKGIISTCAKVEIYVGEATLRDGRVTCTQYVGGPARSYNFDPTTAA